MRVTSFISPENINRPSYGISTPLEVNVPVRRNSVHEFGYVRIAGILTGVFVGRQPLQALVLIPVIFVANNGVNKLEPVLLSNLDIIGMRPKVLPLNACCIQIFLWRIMEPEWLPYDYQAARDNPTFQCF